MAKQGWIVVVLSDLSQENIDIFMDSLCKKSS